MAGGGRGGVGGREGGGEAENNRSEPSLELNVLVDSSRLPRQFSTGETPGHSARLVKVWLARGPPARAPLLIRFRAVNVTAP